MNKKQKFVIWVGLGLFFLSLFAIPVVTFNGTWTATHALHGIKHIPFFLIDSNQKSRIDILSVEWIGIGIITFLLFSLLKGAPATKENSKDQKRGLWKMLKYLLIILVVLPMIAFSAFEGIKFYQETCAKSCISHSELSFSNVELKSAPSSRLDPNDPFADLYQPTHFLNGVVANNSKEYSIQKLSLKVSLLDILPNGKVVVMASDSVNIANPKGGYNDQIPPGQAMQFQKEVCFGRLPTPYGKQSWSYAVDEIIGSKTSSVDGNSFRSQIKPSSFGTAP